MLILIILCVLYCLNLLEHILFCSAHHLLLKTTHRVKRHMKLLSINSQSLLPFFSSCFCFHSLFYPEINRLILWVKYGPSFEWSITLIKMRLIETKITRDEKLALKLNKFFNLQKVTFLINISYLEMLNVYYLRLL